MFGVSDIPKFFLAFFLVLPVISLLHESGHIFFAWLMGAKNIKVVVGSGKVLARLGILEIRRYYFWYGFCTFESLKRNNRLSYMLIYSGGALFNGLSVVGVIYLIENKLVEPGMLTYQFTYFSLYYIFFALLPMPYPGGSYSDGKILLDLIRNKKEIVGDNIYRVQWNEEKRQWFLLDNNGDFVEAFADEEKALKKAHEVAQNNRPSRLLNSKSGKEVEVQNYPRLPL